MKKPKSDDEKFLPVELLNYLKRVGAEVVSFRRAVIREKVIGSTYGFTEKFVLKITNEGMVEGRWKNLLPTKEEQAEIIEAYKKIKLPKSLNATKAAALAYIQSEGGDPDRFFLMWDRKDNKVRMLHEKIVEGEGKGYVPHTLWNDGEWRKMEPDEALPFWKPEKPTGKNWIMIHEGAKTARTVHLMTEEQLDKHPWGNDLRDYEHWGMIGGAINPFRSDWDELRREKPKKVVYVCDNDVEGKSALQIVSQAYKKSLVGIMFDNNFPESWDMADEMPKKYSEKLVNYMTPATWATRAVKRAGTKLTYELMTDFKREWVHSTTPDIYVHVDWPSNLWSPKEFNNWIRPFSDMKETTLAVNNDKATKAATLDYIPWMKPGIFTAKGKEGLCINTHSPSEIEPVKGDVGPFLEYMERLIAIEADRIELMRWMATLIARPDIKMHYGVLLVSETQGVGKSTIGYILRQLIGEKNVSMPDEREVVDSSFNDWKAFKRLVIIEEIYAGHSSKAYDALKSMITEPEIRVNEKYRARYQVPNWAHILATSNSMRALKIDNEDRRWFIPEVTEEGADNYKYWNGLRNWLNEKDGLAIIKWWATDWLKKNAPVVSGTHAPRTTTKEKLIEENYSEGQTLVNNFLKMIISNMDKESWLKAHTKPAGANGEWKPVGLVMFDQNLVDLIKSVVHEDRRSPYLEKRLTIRKLAKGTKRFFIHKERNLMINGTLGTLLCSSKDLSIMSAEDIRKVTRPLDVKGLFEGWQKV